jgi:hypothetical protein
LSACFLQASLGPFVLTVHAYKLYGERITGSVVSEDECEKIAHTVNRVRFPCHSVASKEWCRLSKTAKIFVAHLTCSLTGGDKEGKQTSHDFFNSLLH